MTAPLDGIRVLDFGIYAAGPMCSVVLGDLGADIIRIEPVTGEPLRGYFRGYSSVNRGKRVLALDMKAAESREILDRLTARADVVHYNYRPGVAARLGIDAKTLRAQRPEMIVLDAPGYGAHGPKASQPAFDMVLQGYTGHEVRLGGKGQMPLWSRLAFIDVAAGLLGANAVLALLYKRARTGIGGETTVSLIDTALYLMSELVRTPSGEFVGADLLTEDRLSPRPARSIYKTADGWIAIVLYEQQVAARFAQALSVESQLSSDPELWGEVERVVIAGAFADRKTADVVAALCAVGVWAEECRCDGGSEIIGNALLHDLGSVLTGSHERFGALKQMGPQIKFSRSSLNLHGRGYVAEVGGDTRAIMGEYGYSDAEIASLYERKVIA